MDFRALELRLNGELVGHLFRYAEGQSQETIRFVPAESYINNPERPTISLLYNQPDDELTRQTLRSVTATDFNGSPDKDHPGAFCLPAWFQNLLPEGEFRRHIAQLRDCSENDHFELLAACGKDLPGALTATPSHLSMAEIQTMVTQNQDALEVSVVDIPMVKGISLSGVQPKIGVNEVEGRYVARTKLDDVTHIIAKLPAAQYPRMPELEHLSMEMASAAGVNACKTSLVPLSQLEAAHNYDFGDDEANKQFFLAVPRYDRKEGKRIQTEDIAQVLGLLPRDKYALAIEGRDEFGEIVRTDVSYALVMQLFMGLPSLGEPAVFELLRRLAVNELLGNPDCHLKNIGLYYPDGVTPELPPAYDMVALHVFNGAKGHALMLASKPEQDALVKKEQSSPALAGAHLPVLAHPMAMQMYAQVTGIAEKRLAKEVGSVVEKALNLWPSLVVHSQVTDKQKVKMLRRFYTHPAVAALAKRQGLELPDLSGVLEAA